MIGKSARERAGSTRIRADLLIMAWSVGVDAEPYYEIADRNGTFTGQGSATLRFHFDYQMEAP